MHLNFQVIFKGVIDIKQKTTLDSSKVVFRILKIFNIIYCRRGKMFYQTPIKFVKRNDMVNFLINHSTHSEGITGALNSYSNNVKIKNLKINPDLIDTAYKAMSDDNTGSFFYDNNFREIRENFENETGLSISFAGRMNGHLILMQKIRQYNNKNDSVNFNYINIAANSKYELESMEIEDLRWIAKAVNQFDTCCDKVRDSFIEFIASIQNC